MTPARVLGALLAVLAGLDLARASLGPGIWPWQWAAGAATLAALAGWLRSRGLRFREALPTLALAAFLLPTYVDHARSVASDGISYYSYLRSLLFDRDLDLRNDFALLGLPMSGPNVFPVGPSILWSPFVLVVHLLAEGGRVLGWEAPTGVEPAYQAAVCLATLVYGAAGLFLLEGTLRRWAGPAAALWATVVCWVGSPLRVYLSAQPSMAHGCEFFATVLVMRASLALRDRLDAGRAAWAGAACGLAFLVRYQSGLLLLLPGLPLALGVLRRPERGRHARALLALAGAFVLVALPQMAVWQAQFGVPVLIPQQVTFAGRFLRFAEPHLAETLVSPRGGLFSWHPAMLAAVVGFGLLAFRDARYVAAALPVLVSGWYVNATVFDWFQVRRFTGLVPLLAPGLARLLAPLTRAGVLPLALVAFLALRYGLAVDALAVPPNEAVSVRAALVEVADALVADGYRLLEPGASRAAVALLASYTGRGILEEPVTYVDLGQEPALLRLPERSRTLSEVAVEDGAACRWVRGQEARLVLPLAWSGPVVVTVRARPLESGDPPGVESLWNGVPIGRRAMTPGWAEYRFDVPAEAVRPGTNVLAVRFDRGPIYHRVRGEGPHEVRPAALAWLALHRR